jgi:hypothetical protein
VGQPEPSPAANPSNSRRPGPTTTPIVAAQGNVPDATPAPIGEVEGIRIDVPKNFLSGVPGWSGISTDFAVVGTNLFLALLALITLLVATTVFNSTLEENAGEVDTLVKKVSGHRRVAPLAAAMGWLSAEEAGGSNFLLSLIKPALIVGITATIYALLDPGFGLNNATLVLVASLFASIAMSTFLYEGGQVLWSSQHYDTPAAMRVYPVAILIALGCVMLTRVTNLHPGIIFGFVTAAAIFPRTAMSRREEGMIILVPLLGLMLVSAVAFLLIDPLRQFSEDNPGVWATLPETIAVALFVGGAESVILTLLPITFNDGQKIWVWNKLLWFVLALPATFVFFHVIVNDEDYGQLVDDTSAVTLTIICLVVLVISVVTWLFFRLREKQEK